MSSRKNKPRKNLTTSTKPLNIAAGIEFRDEFQLAPVHNIQVPPMDSSSGESSSKKPGMRGRNAPTKKLESSSTRSTPLKLQPLSVPNSDCSDVESMLSLPMGPGMGAKREAKSKPQGAKKITNRNRAKALPKRTNVQKNLSNTPVLPDISNIKEETSAIKRLLNGRLTDLPPMRSSLVRIFLSSTFSDYKLERNILAKEVYPRLRDRCSALDLDFQVVDLRWGVTREATNDHLVENLCFQEIQECKRLSQGPFFVGMLGNRYGYHPLPARIDQTEFEILKSVLEDEDPGGWKLLEAWYTLDKNADPAVYMLQAINSRLEHFLDFTEETEDQHKQHVAQWNEESSRLIGMLHKSVFTAVKETHLDNLAKCKYIQAVTHQEFNQGLFQMDKDTVLRRGAVFLRNLDGIYNEISSQSAQKHGTIRRNAVTGDVEVDYESEDLLDGLKKRVKKDVPGASVFEYNLKWAEGGIQPELDQNHANYLQKFVTDFENTLWRMIEDWGKNQEMQLSKQLMTLRQTKSASCPKVERNNDAGKMNAGDFLVGLMSVQNIKDNYKSAESKSDSFVADKQTLSMNYEILHHLNFCRDKCRIFCGRAQELKTVKQKLGAEGQSKPLVVVAPSGAGKTAFMAKVAENIPVWVNKNAVVVVRFLGTTPTSSSIRKVLANVCMHITEAYGLPLIKNNLVKLSKVTKYLNELFMVISFQHLMTKPLVIILDSIDQLESTDGAHNLQWLPKILPPGVHLLLSMLPDVHDCFSNAFTHLQDEKCFLRLSNLNEDVVAEYIDSYLAAHKRKLTKGQRDLLVNAFSKHRHPLLMSLLMDEAVTWKSYTPIANVDLAQTARSAIINLFERIERRFGKLFTEVALGYLSVSKGGLSEVEIEDALSCNDDVLDCVYKFHDPPIEGVIRIPPLMWTRVRAELSSFIVERQSSNHTVIYWYHRQFVEAAVERYAANERAAVLHKELAELFGRETPLLRGIYLSQRKKTIEDADRQITPHLLNSRNIRKLLLLPYHLSKSNDIHSLKKETFLKFKFLLSFIEAFSIHELLATLKDVLSEKQDPELQLLYDSLHFSQGRIQSTVSSLGGQLLGQLRQHSDQSTMICELCQQAEEAMERSKHPTLIPTAGSIPASSSTLRWFTTGFYGIGAISHDASILLAQCQREKCSMHSILKINTLSRGRNLMQPKKDPTIQCVISKDNQRVFILSKEEVSIHHVTSGEILQTIDANVNHAGLLNMAMTVSSCGQYLVLAGADRLGMLEEQSSSPDEAQYKVRRAMNFNGAIKSTNLIFSHDTNFTISTHTIKGAKMVLGAAVMWDFWGKQLKTRVALPTVVEPGFLHLMPPLGGHNLVVCGCHDGQIFIIDMDLGKSIVQFGSKEVSPSPILSRYDSSLNIVLTARTGEQVVKVWKTDIDNSCLLQSVSTSSAISALALSADTNMLVTGHEKGGIGIYDLDGNKVIDHQGHEGKVTSLMCDEKEQLASCGEDGILKLWDIEGFIQIQKESAEEKQLVVSRDQLDGELSINGVELSSSHQLVTASSNGLKLWEAGTQSVTKKMELSSDVVHQAKISPDGKHILSTHGSQREMKLWNCDSQTSADIQGFDGMTVHHILWSEQSAVKAYVSASKSNFCMLMEFDCNEKKPTSTFPLSDGKNVKLCCTLKQGAIIICLVVSESNKHLGYPTYKAMAIDLASGSAQICLHHNSKTINTDQYEKPVFCVDKLDEETVLLGCHNDLMAWQPPEKECFLMEKEGMRSWMRHSRLCTRQKQGWDYGNLPITALVVARDKQSFASGDESGSVVWWKNAQKIETPKDNRGVILAGHSAAISSLVISSNASILVSGSLDRSVRVWSVAMESQLCSLYTHMVVQEVSMCSSSGSYVVAKCHFAETSRVLVLKLSSCYDRDSSQC